MENIKELLPTGSVVRLVDGEKYLMIVGVMQTMAGIRKKGMRLFRGSLSGRLSWR